MAREQKDKKNKKPLVSSFWEDGFSSDISDIYRSQCEYGMN